MTHRKQLLATAITAACALTATLAATAHALPTILPETIKSWLGKNVGTFVLETGGGSVVECKSAGQEGTVEQPKALGLFHIHFRECSAKASGIIAKTCTGLGDEPGTILSLGSWHLVWDSLEPLGVAILYLLDNVHFVCSFEIIGNKLYIVPLGAMVLCLVLNPTTLTAVFEFHCKAVAAGVTEESKYYNEGGTLVSIHRNESAVNEGTEEESVEKALGTLEYPVLALLMI